MDSDVKSAPKFAIRTMHMDIEAARKGEKAKPAAHSLSEDALVGKGTGVAPRVQIERPTSWRAYTPAQEQESAAGRSLTSQRPTEYKPAQAPVSQQPLKSIPAQAPETIFSSTPEAQAKKRPAGMDAPQTTPAQAPITPAKIPQEGALATTLPQKTTAIPAVTETPAPPPQAVSAPAAPLSLDALLSRALGAQDKQTTTAPANATTPGQPVKKSPETAPASAPAPARPPFADHFTAPAINQSAEDIVSSVLIKKDAPVKEKGMPEEKEGAPSLREFKISSPTTSGKTFATAAQVQSVARKNLPSYLREMPKPPSPDGAISQETGEQDEQPEPVRSEIVPERPVKQKEAVQPEQKKVYQETKREVFGDATLPQIKKELPRDEKGKQSQPEAPKEGDYFTVPKKKILPKILIIVGAVVIVGAVGFAVYTILFKNAVTPPGTTPQKQTEQKQEAEQPKTSPEEKPAEAPAIAPKEKMPALIRYDQQVELAANTTQLKQTLTQATELGTLTGPLVLMQLLQNDSHLSVAEFFSAMNIPLPGTIAEKTEAFNAVLHIDGRDKRLGVILKVSDAFVVDSALSRWQDEIIKGAPQEEPAISSLFLNLPHPYADTQPAFQEVIYNNTYIKYINLPDSDISFDYALITDYKQNSFLVFATSQKQISALVDGILTASR